VFFFFFFFSGLQVAKDIFFFASVEV